MSETYMGVPITFVPSFDHPAGEIFFAPIPNAWLIPLERQEDGTYRVSGPTEPAWVKDK